MDENSNFSNFNLEKSEESGVFMQQEITGASGGESTASITTMDSSEKISLPGTHEEVTLLLKDVSASDEIKATIQKYSGGALTTGRPLDSLQIILAGYSGSGKSSTINFLFDDPDLCQTSSSRSETRDPVMVQKRLVCSQARGPPVEGTLNLIDLPGNFDTDNRKEVCNLASIRKFVDSMFASREGLSICGVQSRATVYPNLVLFTIKATDNRLEGTNTNLRKALKLLQQIGNLVDTENPNLIVLITHVCSLGLQLDYFNEDLNEKKNIIRKVVKEVLGICDVDVIPVENQPGRYGLEKCGEYYKLPSEELSHYNLYQAMLKRLEKNNDQIGHLFANWYFQASCPEKQSAAEAVLPTIDVDYSDLAKAATELHILQKGTDPINPVAVFKFESLGYGYDPTNERVKLNIIPRRVAENTRNMKLVEIQGSKFMIPKYVCETIKESSNFQRLTFLEKSEYQEHMKKSYGINDDLKLNMITGSDSKWMNDVFDRRGIKKLSFSQELQMCSFQLAFPEKMFRETIFYKELTGLPTEYNSEDAAKKFLAFFAKWGTHMICKEAVGGNFQLNCTIKSASASKNNVQAIENSVEKIFQQLFDQAYPMSLPQIYHQVLSLGSVGVIQESLEIQGGHEPEHIDWENATFDGVEKWRQTIASKPVELQKSIKLVPYYALLEGQEANPLYKSLFQATKRYMEEPGASCFPSGTPVYAASGKVILIEKLSNCREQLQTLGINGVPFGNAMKLGGAEDTEFCTFLDKKPDELVEYLELQFSNNEKLIVSPGHMIFQFLPGTNSVVGKQTKNFQVGDMAVYMGASKRIEYPVVEAISKEIHTGAYSPLTMSGSFLANGFLVSSYSNIDSFAVANSALFPLKIWCKLNRSIDSKRPTEEQCDGIHPYAKFLMSVRKLLPSPVSPN